MKRFKIKFNLIFSWHLSVFIFLFLIVALLIFNIFYFFSAKSGLTSGPEGDTFIPERIDKILMLELVSGIDNRKQVFQEILLEKTHIKNPSSL